MFSVTPEIYRVIFQASRWLFVLAALLLLLHALRWQLSESRERWERLRSLPDAGSIGEMVVIAGASQLPADTWFPVPREGILGSLRSCDLVVPCPGVHGRHLRFSWQDGTGLVLRPFAGCDVLIDGALHSARDGNVMVHGSCLQVGDAVLRLQLFSALEHTNRPCADFASPAPAAAEQGFAPIYDAAVPPAPDAFEPPLPGEYPPVLPEGTPAAAAAGLASHTPTAGEQGFAPVYDVPVSPVSDAPADPRAGQPRRRRADRWKEDFSE